MGLMEGKNVVIFGVANKRSIAWGIAQALQREGANLALGYQNERMGDAVKKLAGDLERPPLLLPCDVTVDGDIERFFERMTAVDARLSSPEPLRRPAERLFQGPLADALGASRWPCPDAPSRR